MSRFIRNKLTTVSTRKLAGVSVGISVVITIILTGGVSILLLGSLSPKLFLANALIGIIVPAIVAPFVITLLKEATKWEQVNQELKQENIERKKLETEASRKAKDMQSISELAIKCAAAPPDEDIVKLIAEELRDITNALGVAVTLFDSKARTLTTKHIAISNQVLTLANKLVGYNLIGMINHVTPEAEKHMLTGTVDTFSDLSEVTFGAIPKPIATIIKNTIGIGAFTGLAFTYAGKLIGTAIIAHKDGQPMLDLDVCKTLAHVSAVSIQRKSAENALRESEIKFRTIIENLSDGLLLLDEQGIIIEWNPSQELLSGLNREDVLGKPIWNVQFQMMPDDYQTPEFYEMMKQGSQNILTSGKFAELTRPLEGIIQSKSGEAKHIMQTSFPIQTNTGYRVGSIMRDISNQKQTEKDRENLIAELKAKNTELEQFTHTVSHDLKAPLITIKGFLGLLEKDATENNIERTTKDIVRIKDATEKMHQLLNKLLELSRIGRIANPSQEISFEEIVNDAIAAVHGRMSPGNIKVNLAKDLPIVCVDRIRLTQVVQNLIDNAAKFMGDQPNPLIEIGLDENNEDGQVVVFVKDNGKGIANNQLERVFGLFQKLDSTAEGTGVGLALVKRIIEVHGGRTWITSEGIGQGTTVYFTLPVP